eukprot:m.231364 g.231364  ORF g.231364 m.231364 type:complete len:55 (+) comp18344_c0_seq1:144-308(+)
MLSCRCCSVTVLLPLRSFAPASLKMIISFFTPPLCFLMFLSGPVFAFVFQVYSS